MAVTGALALTTIGPRGVLRSREAGLEPGDPRDATVTSKETGKPAPQAPQATGKPAPEIALAAAATEVQIREGLVVGLLGTLGRSAVAPDLVAWQLATATFREPREGDTLGPDQRNRTVTWARVEAGADGWIQNRALSGGYFFAVVNSDRARTMILDASGYYVVRVNGEPRGGEKYGTDWVRHPVRLAKGRNTLLFQGERGRIRARLFDPPAPVFFTESDPTLPDLVPGESGDWWAGIRLVNATDTVLDQIEIAYRVGDQSGTARTEATVSPMTTRKLPLRLEMRAPDHTGPVTLSLSGRARAGTKPLALPAFQIALKAVEPSAHHVRTFVSRIDGSVQYYGVAPMARGSAEAGAAGAKPALVVSLHGAGVEGIGQARAYKPKDWAYVVAPTNRRPYGFDWEDWGRLDALEVLADASSRFGTDPQRTYLTGHSMGGHGTWQVGATEPGLWAAIAPSAGWRSFSAYGGGPVYPNPTPVEQMLARANHPGETTELAQNFLHYGIYILHGDKDDNVPVAQARFMRELLAKFHPDFGYYERPGAGHWWGNECVDWPPLFDFLKQHVRPTDAETSHVEFVTANPGISSHSRFVTIEAQIHPLEYSRVVIDRDPKTGAFKGTTQNVSRLALDIPATATAFVVELDGSRIQLDEKARIAAARSGTAASVSLQRDAAAGTWGLAPAPDPAQKNPQRSGGFKDAFRHRVVLVYGTRGAAEERARAFNKARFDAEMFWYRGNGSVDVIADTAFDPAKARDRNIVLYGNADTNVMWVRLLEKSPIDVRAGRIRIGDQDMTGADLAAYFIRPRADSSTASVGVVAWTGPAGWAAAGPGQYFVSGAGFPDAMIVSAEIFRLGTGGIRALGWFGNDWRLETGEFAWGAGPGASAGK
jgi:dienelactone hydrolase